MRSPSASEVTWDSDIVCNCIYIYICMCVCMCRGDIGFRVQDLGFRAWGSICFSFSGCGCYPE